MLLGCDTSGHGSSRGIGTIRSMCLLVITFGLVVLFATSYIDQYQDKICERRGSSIGNRRRNRDVEVDDNEMRASSEGGGDLDERDVVDDAEREKVAVSDVANTATNPVPGVALPGMAALPPSSSSDWDYDWDAFAADLPELNQQNVPDRTLILVRHGQYDFTTEKLTALGREQAAITGRRLRAENITVDEIIHSTMDRADETARIIHSCLSNTNIPIRPDEMLVEGGPIPPKPTITYWQLPQQTYHRDGPRMEAAFRKYFHRGTKKQSEHTFQILVGHGNIFRFFALRALQLPKDAWMRVFIAHASITMLHIRRDGTIAMTKFGDSGHFPVGKVTY